jgi:succinate dehydrogenase hydrophobic anchor subunit
MTILAVFLFVLTLWLLLNTIRNMYVTYREQEETMKAFCAAISQSNVSKYIKNNSSQIAKEYVEDTLSTYFTGIILLTLYVVFLGAYLYMYVL